MSDSLPPSAPVPPAALPAIVPPKPFAVQAAQFACWAPIAGLLVGFFANSAFTSGTGMSSNDQRTVGLVIFATNILLNIAAVVMAILAMLGMRKHGTKGILIRSLIGLGESILILGSIVLLFLMTASVPDRTADRLIGQWRTRISEGTEPVDILLKLQTGRRGTIAIVVGGAGSTSIAKSVVGQGEWHVEGTADAHPPLRIVMHLDPGHDPNLGDGYEWIIDGISDNTFGARGKEANGTLSQMVFRRDAK